MKKFNVLGIFLILLMVLAGCSTEKPAAAEPNAAPAETPVVEEPKEDEFNPQILFNGSSTLAPVMASISTNFIEGNVTWDKVDASFPEKNIAIYVSAGGSGQGVKSVIDQTSDFGMVARTVKDTEKEQLPELKEFKVGIDALTLGVNPNNPVLTVKNNLTKDEIIKIFSGEFKTWKDLDASLPDKEIIVVTRDIGGGAHEVFQSKVMGDVQVKADAIQAPSMGALVTKIIENEYAIGYASFGVVNQNIGKVATLSVDGVEASEENIINGSYIIQRPLIAIFNGELTAPQQAFMDYVMSEEGLAVVESMGFVPVK
ncbi:phosphate ABC transporter substrate-binding protein [Sedimentibacter saalensis]|uniref:Phosphate ABC transporter substrate-binding protein, PhoT family (TC 3.A.1.7.1) n=1 Tax=Sedimentibacter saalensis TaxID=130788 RepID=A0A562JEA1_9FIRM|nr:phosphate ABC transporter substrate-binding protein [Sedimentibacter saalensis]TWH81646.1 phosphate ABC transporter substrate-binding protein, PhoT family (TC 3.A.1.7.1) [Sedimentibacter saalensis]